LVVQIDPSLEIIHELALEGGPGAYRTFSEESDGCIKVALEPGRRAPRAA
jgi:hypothetical protein